jgi:hypothetical protein
MRQISFKSKNQKRRAQRVGRWLCVLGCVAGLVVAAGVGLIRTQAQESFPLPAINPPGAKASAPAASTAPASGQPAGQQAGASAADASAPGVAKQCADLLKLATDLKTAVDKSSAGTLSVTVVRRAGEIERLAHKVKEDAR